MMHKAILHRVVVLTVLLTTGLALTACGGGGGSAEDDAKDLFLVKFLLIDPDGRNLGGGGTTNAYRDTRLLFEFNEAVDPDSVSTRTIRIGIPTGADLFLEAVGRFEQGDTPNQIIFNPTFTKNNMGTVPDNPLGLNANALYSIAIPSVLDTPTTVQNKDGDGIVHGYQNEFGTSTDYIQNYVQPEAISTFPEAGDVDIPATADIVFTFNVPMKPDSFRLGDSVLVLDANAKRQVLGTLRFSADARVVVFRPVFGYGKGPTPITVRVSTDVTNLPGNPIAKEILFSFTSVHDATQPDFADIQELFDDTAFEDRSSWGNVFPLAAWNYGVTTGYLAGVSTSGTLTISRGTNSYNYEPWGIPNFNMQFQALYLTAEMGTARTLTGFDWYKWSYSAITVSNVVMQMGHNTSGRLTTNFGGNYSDTPQNVRTSTTFSINNNPSFAWVAGPTFSSNYKYNGADNLILEINHAGGNVGYPTYGAGLWRVATGQSTQKTAYTTSRGTSPVTWNYNYDIRFQYFIDESEAQSLFYDAYNSIPQIVGRPLPQYLSAVITPTNSDQPVGTSTTIEFQGAAEDPNSPGSADPSNTSAWTDDLSKLTGYRFVRFRTKFAGNPQTKQQPQIDSIVLPFIYF